MTCPWRVSKSDSGGDRAAVRNGRRILRLCAAALALFALTPRERALAEDWLDGSYLRGSLSGNTPAPRWDGLVFGGSIGVTNMNSNLSQGLGPLIGRMLTNSTVLAESRPNEWSILDNQTTNGRSFGGFIGYNFQWDGLVLGVDAGYNKTSGLATSSTGSIERVTATSDSTAHDLAIAGTASTKLIDYATLRVRAGYAFGQFMPYAVLGGAVGRFNYSSVAALSDTQTPQGGTAGTPFTAGPVSDAKNNAMVAGFVGGLGVDIALTPNMFARAEWEYVAFAKVNGVTNGINTGRVGIGVRF